MQKGILHSPQTPNLKKQTWASSAYFPLTNPAFYKAEQAPQFHSEGMKMGEGWSMVWISMTTTWYQGGRMGQGKPQPLPISTFFFPGSISLAVPTVPAEAWWSPRKAPPFPVTHSKKKYS